MHSHRQANLSLELCAPPDAAASRQSAAGAAAGLRGARIHARDFAKFKEDLARQRGASAATLEHIATVPPTDLYALAPLLGMTHWELAEEVGAFLNLPCRERVGHADVSHGGLPLPFCRARLMVPLGSGAETSGFAISNPFDLECIDALTRTLGAGALAAVYLVTPETVHACLDLPPVDASSQVDLSKLAELTRTTEAELEDSSDVEVDLFDAEQLARISQLPTVVQAVNMILGNAVRACASDIHLEPKADDLLVRFRVDGVLIDAFLLPHAIRASVVSRLKVIGRLDIAERRRPQDGRARARFGDKRVDLRISTLPAQFGEKVVVRILNSSGDPITLDDLSLSLDNLAAFKRQLASPQGLVIVTGPTGSGKSTTLYAALNAIKSPEKNVITIENPIEFQISGVTQVQVESKGVTFATVLRSVLRQDPNVIMVGEVRDAETAQLAAVAALTGHLMLTTLHTNDAASSITRLFDLDVEAYQLTSSLSAVLAQRLVRRLCPLCAVPAPVPTEDLRRLGMLDVRFDRPGWRHARGCPECRDTGYKGRIAVQELLEVNDGIRQLIAARASDRDIREYAQRHGMVTMLEDGLMKAVQGFTTIDELLRVVPHNLELASRMATPAAALPIATAAPAPTAMPAPPTTPAPPAAAAVSAPADGHKASILLIEDEWSMQALVRLLLERRGFAVEVVGDGVEALMALGRRPFDLILSDINMPNMDGMSLLQFVKQKGITTPVALLSAEPPEREAQGLALGAISYIRKPFTADVLVARVTEAVQSAKVHVHVA